MSELQWGETAVRIDYLNNLEERSRKLDAAERKIKRLEREIKALKDAAGQGNAKPSK